MLAACATPIGARHPSVVTSAAPPTYAAEAPSPSGHASPVPALSSYASDDATKVEATEVQGDLSAAEPGPEPIEELLPFQQMSYGSVALRAKSPARRYGNLSPAVCAKELRQWKDSFKRVGAYKGIATPTRVIGPIEGVKFRVPGEKSKFGLLDCRLALDIVEFARFLKQRDVVEVVVDNFYRLNARLPSARSKRSQHAYALAIDLRAFRLSDGRVWDVERDWGASTDTEACGPLATLVTPTENTVGLRTLVCELYAEQIFSHHLTPSHDAAHRNHLHLDIKRDAKSAVIR